MLALVVMGALVTAGAYAAMAGGLSTAATAVELEGAVTPPLEAAVEPLPQALQAPAEACRRGSPSSADPEQRIQETQHLRGGSSG